jgi:hypothetical protein
VKARIPKPAHQLLARPSAAAGMLRLQLACAGASRLQVSFVCPRPCCLSLRAQACCCAPPPLHHHCAVNQAAPYAPTCPLDPPIKGDLAILRIKCLLELLAAGAHTAKSVDACDSAQVLGQLPGRARGAGV